MNSPEAEMTYSEARMQIEAIRSQIASMGANDSEFESVNNIIQQLEAGDITPKEAVAMVSGVRDSKQDYH